MPPRARLAQDRSRVRREQLLEAAVALLAEGGTRSVTHRAVSIRAGLPPSTTVYYFTTIEDLLRAAVGHHVRQWVASMERLTDLDASVTRALVGDPGRAVDLVERAFVVRSVDVAARELAIYLAAARDPALRVEAADALSAFEQVSCSLLERAGVGEPQELAAAITAVILGTAVRRQSGCYSEAEEAALLARTLRNLVAAHLLDDAVLDGALRDLGS